MDQFGLFVTRLHSLLGHDVTARFIGQPPGDRRECLLCQYEADPSPERRQAVITALSAPAEG